MPISPSRVRPVVRAAVPSAGARTAGSDPAVRERIVGAARTHFLTHGFRAVTMDDLAAELGMSKKTFYACFRGKTELVKAVILHKTDAIAADLEAITGRADLAFAPALEELLLCLQRHAGELQPAFLRDLRRDAPELFDLVQERRAEMIGRHFGRLLEEGRAEGLVRQDLPGEMVIRVLLAAVEGIVNPERLEALGLTPRAALSTVLQVVLEGVLIRKGKS